MTNSDPRFSAGSAVLLGDLLDECISVEICTVEDGTKQHTRRYLSKEDIAVLANAVNHTCDPAQAVSEWPAEWQRRWPGEDWQHIPTDPDNPDQTADILKRWEASGCETRALYAKSFNANANPASRSTATATAIAGDDRESMETRPLKVASPEVGSPPQCSAGNGDDLSRRARELADEPVIGAEGRKLLRQMATEIEDLRHDIDRHIQIATDLTNEPQAVQVTDDDVERAWAAMVGADVAGACFQASVVRGDIRTALESLALSRPVSR